MLGVNRFMKGNEVALMVIIKKHSKPLQTKFMQSDCFNADHIRQWEFLWNLMGDATRNGW